MMIDHFVEVKGAPFRDVLLQTHALIMDAHPAITHSSKWSLPFYTLKKNLFYLDVQKGRPLVGVYQGFRLPEIQELLDMTNRTRIGHFYLDDFNEDRLAELITIIDTVVAYDLTLS